MHNEIEPRPHRHAAPSRSFPRVPLSLTQRGRTVIRVTGVTVVFLIVVGIEFRPGLHQVFRDVPANLGDPALIIWFLAWGGHAFAHQPLHYFDANIFWPHHATLAYSENMAPLVPLYNAVYQPSDNWALALNVLVLSLVLLNLWATYALARWLTRRSDVALVAAVAFGTNGYVVSHWGHIQLQSLGFLPLAFLIFFRMLEGRRLVTAFVLGLCGSALILSALYYGAVYALSIGVMLLGYLAAKRFRPGPGLLRCLAVAGMTTAVIVLPFAVPYVRAQHQPNLRRPMDPTTGLNLRDVVSPATGSRLYPALDRLAKPGDVEHRFFPGFATAALAGVGLVGLAVGAVGAVGATAGGRRSGRRRRPVSGDRYRADGDGDRVRERGRDFPVPADRILYVWLLGAAAAAAVVLALGPTVAGVPAPYRFFYHHVPGFAGTRITSRFAVMALLAGAMLAAIGLQWLTRRLPTVLQAGAALAVVVVLLFELSASIPMARLPTSPAQLAVYHELARRPNGAVVELPIEDPRVHPDAWPYVEAPRLVYSTIDFKPRLNGYSGGLPVTYFDDLDALQGFPRPASLDRLRVRRVRFVVVHVGTENGFPDFTEAEAAQVVAGLPLTARAERYGDAYLIDLGQQ